MDQLYESAAVAKPEPFVLEGEHVRLVELELSHLPELTSIGLDEELWRFTTIRLASEWDMREYVERALADPAALPFVIKEKSSDKIVGCTRFHNINIEQRRVEIGFTWIAPSWQRTVVNTETKYLMLADAFERFDCVRVEFKVDASNLKSCQAVERIGARREGVLRNYVISKHKGLRDMVIFSIIRDEWPDVKVKLERKLGKGPAVS